jgi:hypothetical protein
LYNFRLAITLKNIDEIHSKQPKIQRQVHTSLGILKISRKKIQETTFSRLLPNVYDKENHTPGMNLKV